MQQNAQLEAQLPNQAIVLIIPSQQTALYNWSLQPPYSNPYYQSLMVDQRPDLYVSGLYTAQQTNPIRSRLRIFDEMVHFGPHPSMLANGTALCYDPVPGEYTYVIDENLQVHLNLGPGDSSAGAGSRQEK